MNREGSVVPHVFDCVFRHGGHRLHGRQILAGGSVDKVGGRCGRGGWFSSSCREDRQIHATLVRYKNNNTNVSSLII